MGKEYIGMSDKLTDEYSQTAVKVSLVSIIGNSALTLFKLLSGTVSLFNIFSAIALYRNEFPGAGNVIGEYCMHTFSRHLCEGVPPLFTSV